MRILHVINSLHTGGAEKLLVDLLPKLNDNNHEVSLCLFNGQETEFKKKIIESGIRIFDLGRLPSAYHPFNIILLRNLLRKERFDVIHTHNTAPQLFTAIASMLSSTRLITTEHSTFNRRRDKWAFRMIDKWMYGRYEKIICISGHAKETISSYLPQISSKLTTIHNGINIESYRNAKPLVGEEGAKSKFIITMVAGFRYQKDHHTAIKALSLLDKNEFELWLVGDGDKKNEIEAEIKNLGLEKSIKLWGIRNDIPSILKSSDAVLQSSHIEGFGLAAVEGMAAGKPVIASDVPGLSEIVGGAGILFPHADYQDLAKQIKMLKDSQTYYTQTAKACVERAKQFDIGHTALAYNSVYDSILC